MAVSKTACCGRLSIASSLNCLQETIVDEPPPSPGDLSDM